MRKPTQRAQLFLEKRRRAGKREREREGELSFLNIQKKNSKKKDKKEKRKKRKKREKQKSNFSPDERAPPCDVPAGGLVEGSLEPPRRPEEGPNRGEAARRLGEHGEYGGARGAVEALLEYFFFRERREIFEFFFSFEVEVKENENKSNQNLSLP